ncbi:Armadillo-type fold [Ostreococcus tauri]|uniref:Armadillo-type fold n=1 Tax=Ostreococcus tauri TaxID=70448 RepID=Q011Y7_OSTTA|nr:Armadillo-type fold [Ostreococcus tauri]CAL55293.1 Armadillo-type fold [Ostreococcus tauri]|eukprot:XP_003081124.1 Armadillo-type fold [Ostreococcus tauri]
MSSTVDELTRTLERSLALDDRDAVTNKPSTSKTLTAAQRTRELCGWTPRALDLDLDRWLEVSEDEFARALERIVAARAETRSKSTLRLWWRATLGILSARRARLGAVACASELCAMLVEDVADLATSYGDAPDRERWGEITEELRFVNLDVATRAETLSLATRELYANAPEALVASIADGLRMRQSQSTRGEAYWLAFALCAVDPLGDASMNLTQVLTKFNPSKWVATHRKSDFRHCLSTMLTVVASRFLSRGPPKMLDVDVTNSVLADVLRWTNENEKKHAHVAVPLRAVLIGLTISQESEPYAANAITPWRLMLDARIKSGIDIKMKISTLLTAIRGVLQGVSCERTDVVEVAIQSLTLCIRAIKLGYDMDDTMLPLAMAQCVTAIQQASADNGERVLRMLRDENDDSVRAAVCIVTANAMETVGFDDARSDGVLSAFADMTLPKLVADWMPSSSVSVTKAILVCLRFTNASQVSMKNVEFACNMMSSESVSVRNAAESFLLHVIRSKADNRDDVLQVLASTLLNLRDVAPAARLSAVTALLHVCKTWNACLRSKGKDEPQCNWERAEAASLLLVCDADFSVRCRAIEALEEISKLASYQRGKTMYDLVQRFLDVEDVSIFIREVSIQAALEGATSYTTAHAQAYQRIQSMMVTEGDGKLLVVPVNPTEYKYNLWQNYMLFVCSGDVAHGATSTDIRQVVTVGHRGSLPALLQTVIPRLGYSNGEVDAIMRLFQIVPEQSKTIILSALLPLQDGLRSSLMKRNKREDLSMLIGFGQVYQGYAVDGVFASSKDSAASLDAAINFVLMVCSYLKTAKSECSSIEINQLKFAAAAIIGGVLTDVQKVKSLPVETQRNLWDEFYVWQEQMATYGDTGDMTSRAYVHCLIGELAHDYTKNPTDSDVVHAAREALASLSVSEQFARETPKQVFAWANKLILESNGPGLELPHRVILNLLRSNPSSFRTTLDLCYSSLEKVSKMHLLVLSELSEDTLRALPIAHLIALVLHKIVDDDADVRSATEVLLHFIKQRSGLAQRTDSTPIRDEKLLIDELKDLLKMVPQHEDGILLEFWKRELNETRARSEAQRTQTYESLIPWISALHLPHLVAAEKSDELLTTLFQVTLQVRKRQSKQVGKLWIAMGAQPRNVAPALKFLQEQVPAMASTSDHGEIWQTAKVVSGWLAQTSPQQAVDQLVYTISFRALESDEGESSKQAPSRESATQPSSKISPADVGIILLSELAAVHKEDFRFHLPVLAHTVVVTLIVTTEAMVREHCGELLCNLAMGLTADKRALNGKNPVFRLARLFADDVFQPWKLSKIRFLIRLLPLAIDLDENLPQRWANEARRWLLRSPSFSLACASAMTLISLNVPMDEDAFSALLSATCVCASISEGGNDKKNKMARELAQHLLKTLAASLCDMMSDEVMMYTQLFWCGAMCLRTQNVELYSCAIDLAYTFLYKCSPLDELTFDVITSCAPLPRGAHYPEIPLVETLDELLEIVPEKLPSAEISWSRLVLLVMKGLFQSQTFVRSVRVLVMLVPHLTDHERWNDVHMSLLISYATIPLVLAAADESVHTAIGVSEARTIACRLAQGLRAVDGDLANALATFSANTRASAGDPFGTAGTLERAFAEALARPPSGVPVHLPVHCLREFSLCADAATADKTLKILSNIPKSSSKSFKRDLSTMWSGRSASGTVADAMYGVLLSARLDTDSKGAAPACLDY